MLDTGAEFRIRQIEVVDSSGVAAVRFIDPRGISLCPSEEFVPASDYAAGLPGPPVIEPEIICQSGAVLRVDVSNIA